MSKLETIEQIVTGDVAWTGSRYVSVRAPRPEDMILSEIATGLSRENRFGGSATALPWSVGQHSLLVLHLMQEDGVANRETLRCGLMHDAPEYIIGDLISPVKVLCPNYQDIEAAWWRAISTRFNLPYDLPSAVHYYDTLALSCEKHTLISPQTGAWAGLPEPRLIPVELMTMTPKETQKRFLAEAAFLGVAA